MKFIKKQLKMHILTGDCEKRIFCQKVAGKLNFVKRSPKDTNFVQGLLKELWISSTFRGKNANVLQELRNNTRISVKDHDKTRIPPTDPTERKKKKRLSSQNRFFLPCHFQILLNRAVGCNLITPLYFLWVCCSCGVCVN